MEVMKSLKTLIGIMVFLISLNAQAVGKKRTQPPVITDTQAYPARVIALGKFIDTPFLLPDGKTKVDVGILLPELVMTTLFKTTAKLKPSGIFSDESQIQERFVLRGGITSFEAENTSLNIKIGYKPGTGDLAQGKLTGVEGAVNLTVSSLGIDFSIYDKVSKQIVAVGRGDGLGTGFKTNVQVDFSQVQSGADFMFKTKMADLFMNAAKNAIQDMVSNTRTNFLMFWETEVVSLDSSTKSIWLNVGQVDEIAFANTFTVYDQTQRSRIAEIQVHNVDFNQSRAVVKNDPDYKLFNYVRVGDKVRIYFNQVPRLK